MGNSMCLYIGSDGHLPKLGGITQIKLPVFSKIFEKLFLVRLEGFLDKFDILSQDTKSGLGETNEAVSRLADLFVDGLDAR